MPAEKKSVSAGFHEQPKHVLQLKSFRCFQKMNWNVVQEKRLEETVILTSRERPKSAALLMVFVNYAKGQHYCEKFEKRNL